MMIKTIKRSNGENVVVLRQDNGQGVQGVRLVMTKGELARLVTMLLKLARTQVEEGDLRVEERESCIGLFGFRGM